MKLSPLQIARYEYKPKLPGMLRNGIAEISVKVGEKTSSVADQEVAVGIRPEGFVLDDKGPLVCKPVNVEVMGRDVSVVSTHPASVNPLVRSIINADNRFDLGNESVRYTIKPHKIFILSKDNEERLRFEVK